MNFMPGPNDHSSGNPKSRSTFAAVIMPPVPLAELIAATDLPSSDEEIEKIAVFTFDQANHALIVQLSRISTEQCEADEARKIYDAHIEKRRKTDPDHHQMVKDPERPLSLFDRLVSACLFLVFLGALAFVAAVTANFVIDADLYPALDNSYWLAVLTTGITMTVGIGGPIVLYHLKDTDQDRRRFAERAATLGIVIGILWLVLFALVDGLDNYNVVFLPRHRFIGTWSFLNSLLPAAEQVARFFMVIAQIMGECAGAVAIELHATRFRASLKRHVTKPNPQYVGFEARRHEARAEANEFALDLAHLLKTKEHLDNGRRVFLAMCRAAVRTFEIDNEIAKAADGRKFLHARINHRATKGRNNSHGEKIDA